MKAAGYGIGIDTGGTFTDSVLKNLETGEIESFAKVPTTHFDLGKGIETCLDILLEDKNIEKDQIKVIGVSSTLATNAVVENKGGDTALFIIGIEKHMELPVAGFKFIEGGHDVYGNEVTPLNMEALVDGISFFRGRVDSYAVVSAMSFANPSHELVAKKAISLMDNKPVYISSDVSSAPGLEERAATAVLNARLMPVMESFIRGLKKSVEKYADIKTLKIIDGAGGFLNFDEAVERSVKTFGSGPASTAYFGAMNADNALVCDIGGTTTDILLVEDKNPVTDNTSRIGDLDTHVKTVRMKTIGLGGDSRIGLDLRKNIFIGPKRVNPICFADSIPDPGQWLNYCGVDVLYSLCDNENIKDEVRNCFKDNEFLTINDFYKIMGKGEKTKERVEDFVNRGFLNVFGFTPTDVLCVLNKINAPYPSSSNEAAVILSKELGISVTELCEKLLGMFEDKIIDSALEFLTSHYSGKKIKEIFPDWRNNKYIKIEFSCKFPIVGAGAAADHFLAGVAEKMKTKLVLPDYHEVGNAVGALNITLLK
ncbi:MAG: hydantoinase/oxoprolinase family protein [Desulfobacteraceae bacterium]|nr:hydantoinase/oxoprolinase family protein [Desulfobacteraceae bacterium]